MKFVRRLRYEGGFGSSLYRVLALPLMAHSKERPTAGYGRRTAKDPPSLKVYASSSSVRRGSVFQAGRVEVGFHSPTPTTCKWPSAC